MNHHDRLVQSLKSTYAAAGGPISLPRLLRLAAPKIQTLLDNGVSWRWLGARILAVHSDPESVVPRDIPALDSRQVRDLVAEFSRQKRRDGRSKRAPPPWHPSETTEPSLAPPQEKHRDATPIRPRPPARSSRASIHAAATLNSSLRKLET